MLHQVVKEDIEDVVFFFFGEKSKFISSSGHS